MPDTLKWTENNLSATTDVMAQLETRGKNCGKLSFWEVKEFAEKILTTFPESSFFFEKMTSSTSNSEGCQSL